MELTTVIQGPIVTEKAERQKAAGTRHTYTLRVSPRATKIDVRNALKKFYDVDVTSVRISWTQPKTRLLNNGTSMEKRHRYKKALVTLAAKSKPLDLASFQTVS